MQISLEFLVSALQAQAPMVVFVWCQAYSLHNVIVKYAASAYFCHGDAQDRLLWEDKIYVAQHELKHVITNDQHHQLQGSGL